MLFSDNERSKEPNKDFELNSKDAVVAQDVQSFFSVNPDSRNREQVEFWEDRIFTPNLKR